MRKIILFFSLISFTVIARSQHQVFELMDRTDLTLQEIESRANRHFDSAGTGRGTGYKQFQRWLYERKFHTDENGYFISPHTEWNNYLQARNSLTTGRTTAGNWCPLAPAAGHILPDGTPAPEDYQPWPYTRPMQILFMQAPPAAVYGNQPMPVQAGRL